MILLFLKNFWWAAWWPYYTMLLALEKACQAPNRPKAPQPGPYGRGTVKEGKMTSDAFMQPEALRDLMKMSIEQARRAFETFVSTSEKTWKSLESSSPSGRASLYALNAKIAEITRLNVEANFALAVKLTEAKDAGQAVELQSQHVKKQMETFVRQLEEMRDLTEQMIQDANPATRTGVSSPRSAPSESNNASGGAGSGAGHSSYAPSSSFTPGRPAGRSY